jgi:hypothetical protein
LATTSGATFSALAITVTLGFSHLGSDAGGFDAAFGSGWNFEVGEQMRRRRVSFDRLWNADLKGFVDVLPAS